VDNRLSDTHAAALAYIELYELTLWRAMALTGVTGAAAALWPLADLGSRVAVSAGALEAARIAAAIGVVVVGALVHGSLLTRRWARRAVETGIEDFATDFNRRAIDRLYAGNEHLPRALDARAWVPWVRSGDSDGTRAFLGLLIAALSGLVASVVLTGVPARAAAGPTLSAAAGLTMLVFGIGPLLAWYALVYPRAARECGVRLPWRLRLRAWSPIHVLTQYADAMSRPHVR
jgi:hypothetical protein